MRGMLSYLEFGPDQPQGECGRGWLWRGLRAPGILPQHTKGSVPAPHLAPWWKRGLGYGALSHPTCHLRSSCNSHSIGAQCPSRWEPVLLHRLQEEAHQPRAGTR